MDMSLLGIIAAVVVSPIVIYVIVSMIVIPYFSAKGNYEDRHLDHKDRKPTNLN